MGNVIGWTIVENGIPSCSIDESEESLLIGYDMISLRGLEKCKSDLIGKGMVPTQVNVLAVTDEPFHGWGFTVNGSPDLSMCSFGSLKKSLDSARITIALYLDDDYPPRGGRFPLTEAERKTCKEYHWIRKNDGRQRSRLARLTSQVDGILTKYGICIVKIRFDPIIEPERV